MLEILVATWAALVDILSGAWDLVETVAVWAGSVLYHLHTDAPRLEGLLVGVLLAWILLRRDRHPLLRVLSAPLKLLVDILDLVWDQAVEIVLDVKDTAVSWVRKTLGFVVSKIKGTYKGLIDKLTSIRSKLKKDAE